ncbi:transketolase [Hypericibacter adhaerens]|uniref:Transketolase n=2 Tax=Hypericibacter adhaerens TaxID=2602016 RepID=A0A5J6N5Z2_9PROT|nr:transketolase [Hypericibacter adhaerens]
MDTAVPPSSSVAPASLASPSLAHPSYKASPRDMANAIRALAMDAVEKAASGHPGMPMGMADVATVLWSRFLKFDAAHPHWPDRDRFVLSAGHGSMLLYSLLHLTGFADMTLDELRRFRQLGSRTAGHPEYGHAAGIETTTGPLGQGLGNAVGMALAERMAAARFGADLVDHYTYVIAGDGCLMEGISHEAISLAGHLKLGKLIVLFDDNSISIDGPTSLAVSDDQIGRFKASGWATASVDGHDPEAVAAAIEAARTSDRPTLIACKTVIGFGAPKKAGTAATHGAPLGADEVAGAREKLGWSFPPFTVPETILQSWRQAGSRGSEAYQAWTQRHAAHKDRAEFDRRQAGELPAQFAATIEAAKKAVSAEAPKLATRQSSQRVLEALSPVMPELLGGSADLTGSNNTKAKDMAPVTAQNYGGRYVYWGVREHGMAAAMNGIALHGGFAPYGGTFLVFTDYCRPSIRLSALMGQRVVYVMTHDSIGLGEDGPTHQPVEHLASLRAIPNLLVFRPCDTVETAECWALALAERHTPSVLALTRQAVPTVRTAHTAENRSARGGYVLQDSHLPRQVTLIATGSEVALAVEARARLEADGIGAAVVSMPSWELFDRQPASYREEVLGATAVRVAIEAASVFGWERYVGPRGAVIGMTGFGASAPAGDLYKHFGITADAAVKAAKARL